MRAIGLDQPYATLLVSGIKEYETRGRPAPSTLLGQRVAIHANLTRRCIPELDRIERVMGHFGFHGSRPEFAFGAIVGTVMVVDSKRMVADYASDEWEGLSELETHLGDWHHGRYAWKCAEPVQLDQPIPFKGQQGVMILPDDIAARLA